MPDANAIDQSWGFADPKQAKAAGVRVVSMYLSWDASKNATPAKVAAYHAEGIGVLLNWESQAGAPLKGGNQGMADANEAVRLAQALGAPKGTIVYFSCDRDVNQSQWPTIDAYYRAAKAVCAKAEYGLGCYGEADLAAHLAGAGITDAEWQTVAWSGGRVDPAADFYQTGVNGKLGGASVDFDRIIHEDQLGAWWPDGYQQPQVVESRQIGKEFTLDTDAKARFDQLETLVKAVNRYVGAAVDPKTHKPVQYTATVQGAVRDELSKQLAPIVEILKKLSERGA